MREVCIMPNEDYYMGFLLSSDLSAQDSNIGPGLIDRLMTKNP